MDDCPEVSHAPQFHLVPKYGHKVRFEKITFVAGSVKEFDLKFGEFRVSITK